MTLQKTFDNLRLAKVDEAARRYGCSRSRIDRACKAGHIDAYQPGMYKLIDLDTADAWFMSEVRVKPNTQINTDTPIPQTSKPGRRKR